MINRIRNRLALIAAAIVFFATPSALAADTPLSAVIAGGLYNSSNVQGGFVTTVQSNKIAGISAISPAYEIAVRVAITGALPAYSKTGSAGSEVLTATSNGAFPQANADGQTLVASDLVLIYSNTTSAADAGVFAVTATGSGGAPWVFTRTGLTSSVQLSSTTVRVLEGFDWSGNAFRLNLQASAITVGTTSLNFIPLRPFNGKYGYRVFEDFDEQGSTATIAGASTTAGPFGTSQMAFATGGTATAITYDNILATGSRTLRGVATFSTGTATNGFAQSYSEKGIVLATETSHVIDCGFQLPTLSDGTNTFTVECALNTGATDGLSVFVEGNVIKLKAVNASTVTKTVTGPTMNAAQYYRARAIKPAGANTATLVVDGVQYGTYSSGEFSTTAVVLPSFAIVKSAGTTARTVLADQLIWEGYDPLGRGR